MKKIFVFALLMIATCTYAQEELKTMEFYELMQSTDNKMVIDIRQPNDFQTDRIEGAILCESSDILEYVLDGVEKDTPIFIYCEYGERTPTAAAKVSELGYTTIYCLKKGLGDWRKQGLPLDTEPM